MKINCMYLQLARVNIIHSHQIHRDLDQCQSIVLECFFYISLQNQKLMNIDTELDGYRRQIKKTQEQNEQLTYMQNRIEGDIAMLKKQIALCQNKHEALKIQYSTYSRTLHETEQQLNRTTTVCCFVNSLQQLKANFLYWLQQYQWSRISIMLLRNFVYIQLNFFLYMDAQPNQQDKFTVMKMKSPIFKLFYTVLNQLGVFQFYDRHC